MKKLEKCVFYTYKYRKNVINTIKIIEKMCYARLNKKERIL